MDSIKNHLRVARQHRDKLIDMRDETNNRVAAYRDGNGWLPAHAALCYAVELAEREVKRLEVLQTIEQNTESACPV